MRAFLNSLSRSPARRIFGLSLAILIAGGGILLGHHLDARVVNTAQDLLQDHSLAPLGGEGARGLAATTDLATPTYCTKKIQEIRVGERVMAHNPELSDDDRRKLAELEPEPDPDNWRHLSLRMTCDLPDGGIDNVEIELLRPLDWIAAYGAAPGATVFLDMEEMDVVGSGEVISLNPCPEIKPGPGRVVTGTFAHTSTTVLDIHVSGLPKPIGVTAKHRFWSLDQRSFVAAEALRGGEHLETVGGRESQLQSPPSPRRGSHRVFNLEVQREHVYRVSASAILVHNNYVVPLEVLRDMQALRRNRRVRMDPTEPAWRQLEAEEFFNEALERLRQYFNNPNWYPSPRNL